VDKRQLISPLYQGMADFLRWRDAFLDDYSRGLAQEAAQVLLQAMSPEMVLYLMLSRPDDMQQLIDLATTRERGG